MKLTNYLKDKISIIIITIISIILITLLDIAFKVPEGLIIVTIVLLLLTLIIAILISYFQKRTFYNTLITNTKNLDKKYLVLETIPKPNTYEEELIYNIMCDINKSMIENVSSYINSTKDFNLLDTLTAYENIALALSIQNVSPKEIDKRIKKVAKELDIESVLKKYPYQMSGGQKQRVAAARAIITNPCLILADEPTGALDSKSSKMLLEKLTYLNNTLGATILMVTHDAYAASYATRIIFIKDGKIYNEIRKGNDTRKEFFDKIIDVVTLLGGDINDAL